MNAIHPKYSETTDLYLQMLRQAQKVEDKKLIQIIIRRMQQNTPALATFVTESGCQITPFPLSCVSHAPLQDDSQFWFELQFWKAVGITVGIFTSGFGLICYALLAVA